MITACLFILLFGLISAQVKPGLKAARERGKKVYDANCLTCHMEDGNGVPRMNPPLTKSKRINGDKRKLITVVLKGLDANTEIDGEYYTNVMAPHDFLNDQQIADVLTFIRTSFGNKASMVTVREVRVQRARIGKGK